MTTRYFRVNFRRTDQAQVVGKVDTDLTDLDLSLSVAVLVDDIRRHFGEEAPRWEVVGIREIPKEDALKMGREDDMWELAIVDAGYGGTEE